MSLSVSDLTADEQNASTDSVQLYLTAIEYTDESGKPVTHLFGRDEHRQKYHVRVSGHRPHFYVRDEDYRPQIENHYAVYDTRSVSDTTLDDEELVAIYTYLPKQVSDLREMFEQTYEADVFYDNRFLIDQDIYTGVEIEYDPSEDVFSGDNPKGTRGEDRVVELSVDVSDIAPCDPPEVDSRVGTIDIEVASESGVPETSEANWPVSTIVTHDSYTDEYTGWLLKHDSHDDLTPKQLAADAELDNARVYTDEKELLDDFNRYVSNHSFDVFTGWYCIPEDGQIKMSDGSEKPICDVEEGESIVGKDGEDIVTTDVVRKEKVGKKETVTIETQFGEDLTVSHDHPVLVADGEEPRYIEAENVSPRQYVLTPIDLPEDGPADGPSTEMAERLGLIASDGSYSSDGGVVFYNNRDELHDVFNTDNALSDANGTKKQRVFTDMSRERAVTLCTGIGLPEGRKDRNKWDLSNIYAWDDESIAAFLGGMFSGDGCVSNDSISFANGNDSARYWIRTLLRRIGIWATDDGEMNVIVGSSSVEEFSNKVGSYVTHSEKKEKLDSVENGKSARTETVPPFFDGGDGVGTDERRIVNDKKRRGINIKRHEIEALGGDRDAYNSFVFDKVESVSYSGADTVYDIETTTHNFVVDERVVHNCNDFDLPYLVNRCRRLSVYSYQDWSEMGDVWITNSRGDPVIGGAVPFDMLDGYDKTMRGEYQKGLEDVAQNELGYGKEDVETSHTEMWKQNPVEFLRYNKVDVELVTEIEQAKGILDLFRNIRTLTGAQLNDCHNPIDNLDVLYLREAKKRNTRLPTATSNERSWFYGAKVLDPQKGVHDNVLYFDLASLYPNLIKMLNIGPDTIVGFEADDSIDTTHSYVDERRVDVKKESDPDGEKFYFKDATEETSFVADVVDDQLSLKEPYRGTDMYIAVKMQVNAQWGFLSDGDSYGTGSRLFNWRMGEAITQAERRILTFTRDRVLHHMKELGYDDVYATHGDTDAAAVSAPSADDQEQLIEDALEVAERVNEDYIEYVKDTFNADVNHMEVELESLASQLFIPRGATTDTPKKRYAQRIIWNDDDGWLDNPEVTVTGLEYVRSDTAKMTARAQKKFVDILLDSETTVGEAKEQFYAWLRDFVNHLKEDEPHDLFGRPKGMQQPADEYGSPTHTPMPTYKGAKYANEYIYGGEEITSGDKPYMYYVEEVGGDLPVRYNPDLDTKESGTQVDAIAVNETDDVPDEIGVDVEKQIERVLKPAISRLMDPVGWDFDESLLDSEQRDLSNYF